MNETNEYRQVDEARSIEDMLSGTGLDFVDTRPLEAAPQTQLPEHLRQQMPMDRHPLIFGMSRSIETVREYCASRGELGGMNWGFETLNKAFEGLNTGVHLIAGQSNIGKSALCMQLAWQIAKSNTEVTPQRPKKAFVLYFSLDDSLNELLPRFIAIEEKVPINLVRFPSKPENNTDPVLMERRESGWRKLQESVFNIAMVDVNEGSSVEYIEKKIEEYVTMLAQYDETYQIVVVIDNFHDITVDAKGYQEENARFDHISDQLSKICTRFDCPMICTAEFRKLNGNRRPTVDDIKQSGKILYEAKAVLLSYNEVSLRTDQANIFWENDRDGRKMPVYEMQVAKSKFGSFKGRIFFEFVPHMSYFREVPDAQAVRYNQMIIG